MCGRVRLELKWKDLHALFGFASGADEIEVRRFNLAPSQAIPVVRAWGTVELIRWGLIHTSENDQRGGPAGINVRAETLVKPSHRKLREQRCLVVTSGFYEWDHRTTPKTPHLIAFDGDAPLILGGVFDETVDADGVVHPSCAVVTVPAAGIVRDLHDRMPLILAANRCRSWLDRSASVERMIAAPVTNGLSARPVSRRLNNPRIDDESVLDPTAEPAAHDATTVKKSKSAKQTDDRQGKLFG